jgi:cation transport regulator
MPYARNSELPPGVKNALPEAAQTIYRKAFNAALAEYGGDEGRAAAVAWAAVKQVYVKRGDQWVRREATTHMEAAQIFLNDLSRHTVSYRLGDNGQFQVEGLPLMRPGTWNGQEYSAEDLQGMAANFALVQQHDGFEPALMPYHQFKHDGTNEGVDATLTQGWFTGLRYDEESESLLGDVRLVDAGALQGMQTGKLRYLSAEIVRDYHSPGMDADLGPAMVGAAWVNYPAIRGLPFDLVMNAQEYHCGEIAATLADTTESDPMEKSLLPPSCFLIVGDEANPTTWNLPYRDADRGSGRVDTWGRTERYARAGPVSCPRVRAMAGVLKGARESSIRPSDLSNSARGKLKAAAKACKVESDVIAALTALDEGGEKPMTFMERLGALLGKKADAGTDEVVKLAQETEAEVMAENTQLAEALAAKDKELAELKAATDKVVAETLAQQHKTKAETLAAELLRDRHILPAQLEIMTAVLADSAGREIQVLSEKGPEASNMADALVKCIRLGAQVDQRYFSQMSDSKTKTEDPAAVAARIAATVGVGGEK